MKVKITKTFKWAREGIHVELLHAGDVVEGRPAQIALAEGWGERVEPEPSGPAADVAADATGGGSPEAFVAQPNEAPVPPSSQRLQQHGGRRGRR